MISPINTTVDTLTPIIDWNDVPQANTYRLQLSESSSIQTDTDGFVCSNCILNEPLSTSNYNIPTGKLVNGKTYYWRVRAGTTYPNTDPKAIPDSGFTNTVSFNAFSLPNAPTVTIQTPTSSDTLTINEASINLAGIATNATSVYWTAANNQSGTATGTTNWQINNIALIDGNNIITITAENSSGIKATDTITVVKNTVQVNKEPTLVSGSISSTAVVSKGSLQLKSIWKDAENNFIIAVKARYRRDGGALGINYDWKEVILDYELGSSPPTFSKTVQINEPEGPYEFEFQASNVEQLGGTILHTTA